MKTLLALLLPPRLRAVAARQPDHAVPRRLKNAPTVALLVALACLPPAARAEWQRGETTLAWLDEGRAVWAFSFDPQQGKPFFHPVGVAGAPSLTKARPADHVWHYGLWFSWKYINEVNYWEENRQSGKSAGATRWTPPKLETSTDGGATIRLAVSYLHPSGRVDLTEARELRISAPAADGSYTIDWRADFTAGKEGALLDRTPMPGEPKGAVNGGYAGLGLRLAEAPLKLAFVTTAGAVTDFQRDRARPSAPAIACNFTDGETPAGAIALLSDPANAGEAAPWYLINSAQMRFACAAILAPKPRQLEPGGRFELYYRIAVRRAAWTPEHLQALYTEWRKSAR
jgi:hypothetical protein